MEKQQKNAINEAKKVLTEVKADAILQALFQLECLKKKLIESKNTNPQTIRAVWVEFYRFLQSPIEPIRLQAMNTLIFLDARIATWELLDEMEWCIRNHKEIAMGIAKKYADCIPWILRNALFGPDEDEWDDDGDDDGAVRLLAHTICTPEGLAALHEHPEWIPFLL